MKKLLPRTTFKNFSLRGVPEKDMERPYEFRGSVSRKIGPVQWGTLITGENVRDEEISRIAFGKFIKIGRLSIRLYAG